MDPRPGRYTVTPARRLLLRAHGVLAGLPLSFVLMVALGLLLAVRALVAQKNVDLREANAFIRWMTELAPDRAATLLWPTVAVMALFVVNLVLSSVEMTKKALATRRSLLAPRSAERLAGALLQATLPGPADAAERVERLLRDRGWSVRSERAPAEGAGPGTGEHRLAASRRQAGLFATLLFHLAFFVILAGALLSVLTRHQGYFELAPGESFVEAPGAYGRESPPPPLFDGYRFFRLDLDRMELAFWPEGGVRDRASRIRLSRASPSATANPTATAPAARPLRLAVNSPIAFEGLSIYQAGREGFIAGISATDTAGTRAEGSLHFPFPERPGDPMHGAAVLPGTQLALAFELRTGMVAQLTGDSAPSARDSVSYLRVFKRTGPHERELGTLVGGGLLEVEGLTLSFDSLKPYMSFAVVRDRGTPVIFAGLVLALLTLVALYFWVPENLWAAVVREGDGARVLLAGASDRYPGAFAARFRDLAEALHSELAAPPTAGAERGDAP